MVTLSGNHGDELSRVLSLCSALSQLGDIASFRLIHQGNLSRRRPSSWPVVKVTRFCN